MSLVTRFVQHFSASSPCYRRQAQISISMSDNLERSIYTIITRNVALCRSWISVVHWRGSRLWTGRCPSRFSAEMPCKLHRPKKIDGNNGDEKKRRILCFYTDSCDVDDYPFEYNQDTTLICNVFTFSARRTEHVQGTIRENNHSVVIKWGQWGYKYFLKRIYWTLRN